MRVQLTIYTTNDVWKFSQITLSRFSFLIQTDSFVDIFSFQRNMTFWEHCWGNWNQGIVAPPWGTGQQEDR